jgi:hypothetical protein
MATLKKPPILKLRKQSPFSKLVYGRVVMMIFDKKESDEILYYLIDEFNKLYSLFYTKQDLLPDEILENNLKKLIVPLDTLLRVEQLEGFCEQQYKLRTQKTKMLKELKNINLEVD